MPNCLLYTRVEVQISFATQIVVLVALCGSLVLFKGIIFIYVYQMQPTRELDMHITGSCVLRKFIGNRAKVLKPHIVCYVYYNVRNMIGEIL